MLRFLLLSLSTCFYFSVLSQCPMGDITLTSQQEIDAFATTNPGCTSTNGSITIEEASSGLITDLSGLSSINNVNGDLIIKNCSALTSLTGLSMNAISGKLEINGIPGITDLTPLAGLNSVGDIVIVFCGNLTSLDGLQSLTTVNSLEIVSNGNLQSLTGLNNLSTINGLTKINSNFVLPSLAGLGSLTQVNGSFQILSNSQLATIDAMTMLTTITGQLQISNNPILSSIGIPVLASVGGQLNITNNPAITSMAGLEALTSIGGAQLEISGNANLTSLTGLNNFTLNNGGININGNTKLSDCATAAICSYLNAPSGTVLISANTAGCNSAIEVETACTPTPVELTRFAAIPKSGQVQLNWETASEINNEGFQVLHSEDGRRYLPVGYVEGKGFSNKDIEYSFIHSSPVLGNNYYQLAQIDFDGTTFFSPIVLTNTKKTKLQIYPNPTTDKITLEGLLPEMYKVVISDLTGIVKYSDDNHSGSSISMDKLSPGYYVVQIFDHTRPTVFSVVKK